MSPPGMLATRLAGRLVVLAGRDARPSRTNVRHPAAAQLQAAYPFVLDGLPGTPARRPLWVAGGDAPSARAASLASSAAPAGPGPVPPWPSPSSLRWTLRGTLRWTLRRPPAYPLTARAARLPWSCPLVGPVGRKNRGRLAPLGGVERPGRKVRFARLIQRPVRDLGGPAVRAASGGIQSRPGCHAT